jgi:hypothetical protein
MGVWPRRGPVVPPILSPWFSWPFTYYRGGSTSNLTGYIGGTNTSWYWPIFVPEPCIITKLWWQNGSGLSGTIDVGVYTEEGKRIISTGATSQTTPATIQSVDIADTALPAGLLYFALGASAGTAAFILWLAAGGDNFFSHGGKREFTYPLPATVAWHSYNGAPLPKFGALVWPRTVL